jgi:type VI secretion system protein ImpA
MPGYAVLEPPPGELRMELKRLVQEGQHEQGLETCEQAVSLGAGRAWLDAQRTAVRCAEALGHTAVRDALVSALQALLKSYPQLPEWTLADDTPTANGETRAWLQQEIMPAPPEPPAAPEPQPAWSAPAAQAEPREPGLPDVEQLALEAARGGRMEEAVELLWREIAREGSGRGRFVRRSQLARICLSTSHAAIALPILRELESEITARQLEQWEEPALVAQILSMYYGALAGDDSQLELRRDLYERICRLAPLEALRLGARP